MACWPDKLQEKERILKLSSCQHFVNLFLLSTNHVSEAYLLFIFHFFHLLDCDSLTKRAFILVFKKNISHSWIISPITLYKLHKRTETKQKKQCGCYFDSTPRIQTFSNSHENFVFNSNRCSIQNFLEVDLFPKNFSVRPYFKPDKSWFGTKKIWIMNFEISGGWGLGRSIDT